MNPNDQSNQDPMQNPGQPQDQGGMPTPPAPEGDDQGGMQAPAADQAPSDTGNEEPSMPGQGGGQSM